jgi:RNA polymerase sigma-70 factor (ECF subfamily)
MHTTPVSLLVRLRQPTDQAAWARFVELYLPLLSYWARRLGLDDGDAADLVQDVFVTLVEKLAAFRHDRDRSFRAWLRTVLTNRWRDARRRLAARPRQVAVALEDVAEAVAGDVLDEREYRRQVVARALALLEGEFQDRTWRAFRAHGVEGRPAADVAAELGVSVNAVYLATSRVLRRLRAELEGLLD